MLSVVEAPIFLQLEIGVQCCRSSVRWLLGFFNLEFGVNSPSLARSGLNLQSQFNLDNITEYSSVPIAPEGAETDKDVVAMDATESQEVSLRQREPVREPGMLNFRQSVEL